MPKARDLDALVAALMPGERVFLPGSAGEVAPLTEKLLAPDAPPLNITANFIPGINPMPTAPLPDGTRFTNPFAFSKAGSQSEGALRHLPVSYAKLSRALPAMRFDTCIATVAPPSSGSRASLGPAVEFVPDVAETARRLIAVINPRLPALPGAAAIDLHDADLVVEAEAPLRTYDSGRATAEARAIAHAIAAFVEDGASVQIGLGKVPDALADALGDRRGLRLHSGMLSDGMRRLVECGALDPDHVPTACVHVGTAAHYEWLRDRPRLAVVPVSRCHTPEVLAALPRLIAVNGAVSVDLFGQANLETIAGRAISGVGGAPDFAAAAARAPLGISIVGLPSTAPGGGSRIVPLLDGPVSLPRHDIDVIATEHGAADLRGASAAERAERLIAVAAPEHRDALAAAWTTILRKM